MEELRTRLNNWLLDLENLTVHCGFEEYWNRVIDKEEWVYFIDIKLENLGKKRVHKHIAKVMKEAAGKWANNRSQLENSSHTTAGQNSRSGKSSGNVEGSSKGSSSSGSSSGSSGNSKVKKLNLEADGQKGIKEMEILGRYIDQYIDDEMVFRFYERLGKQLEFIDIGNSDQGKKSSGKVKEISVAEVVRVSTVQDLANFFSEMYGERAKGTISRFIKYLEKSGALEEELQHILLDIEGVVEDIDKPKTIARHENSMVAETDVSKIVKLTKLVSTSEHIAAKIMGIGKRVVCSMIDLYESRSEEIEGMMGVFRVEILVFVITLFAKVLETVRASDNTQVFRSVVDLVFEKINDAQQRDLVFTKPLLNKSILFDLEYIIGISIELEKKAQEILKGQTNKGVDLGWDIEQIEYTKHLLQSLKFEGGYVDVMDAIPAYFYKLLNAHTKKAGVQSGGYGKPNANLLGGEAQLQHSVDDEKLAQLQEMFGLMTMEQLKEALVNNNGDVGLAALSISELEANIDQNGSMLGDDVDRPLGEEAGFNLDQRRNVFDNDRFDVFNSEDFDESVVLMDKQHRNQQNALANAGVSLRQKTLAAAAAILLDEDEYDDSYDSLDVGAVTVTGDDEEIDEGDQRQQGQKREQEQSHVQQSRQQHEVYLSSLVVSNPDIFLTSQNTRKSKARKELREKTGLTDEQVEGWYKMLMKTPAKLDKIKSEFYLSNPNRENTNKAETDSMQANSGTRTSAAKKTGPAFTAKPEKDIKSTAQRKADQQHKSTRANHNRKAAHSRKYASIQ